MASKSNVHFANKFSKVVQKTFEVNFVDSKAAKDFQCLAENFRSCPEVKDECNWKTLETS